LSLSIILVEVDRGFRTPVIVSTAVSS